MNEITKYLKENGVYIRKENNVKTPVLKYTQGIEHYRVLDDNQLASIANMIKSQIGNPFLEVADITKYAVVIDVDEINRINKLNQNSTRKEKLWDWIRQYNVQYLHIDDKYYFIQPNYVLRELDPRTKALTIRPVYSYHDLDLLQEVLDAKRRNLGFGQAANPELIKFNHISVSDWKL